MSTDKIRAAVKPNPTKAVPVYEGLTCVGRVDQVQAERMALASNAGKVVRARATGEIVRIEMDAVATDRDGKRREPGGGASSYTYTEVYNGRAVTMLRRYNAATGTFVKWGDRDMFDPARFNPDAIDGTELAASRRRR